VQDAFGVRRAQCREDPQAELGRLFGWQRPVLEHDVAQRPVREELHDDPRAAVFLDDVVDAHDVHVPEPRGHLRLAQRAAARRLALLLAEIARPGNLLDRHVPVQRLVVGTPHRAHPAAANNGAEVVPPREEVSLKSRAHGGRLPGRVPE
jgi:hypothetical protein